MARRKGLAIKLGAVCAIAGGILGYLMRPSATLIGQLPFGAVITRGATLKGVDQLVVPLAQKSFNIMMTGLVIGAAAGLVIGIIIDHGRR